LGDIPHVGEVIAAIDLPKCVASSGTPEKIRHGLTCVGLYDQLAPHIFLGHTGAARQARNRILFLFAAEQMGASPARCVVIEEQHRRHISARAAGMTVLGFHGGSLPARLWRYAAVGRRHLTFDDMRHCPI